MDEEIFNLFSLPSPQPSDFLMDYLAQYFPDVEELKTPEIDAEAKKKQEEMEFIKRVEEQKHKGTEENLKVPTRKKAARQTVPAQQEVEKPQVQKVEPRGSKTHKAVEKNPKRSKTIEIVGAPPAIEAGVEAPPPKAQLVEPVAKRSKTEKVRIELCKNAEGEGKQEIRIVDVGDSSKGPLVCINICNAHHK